MTDNEERYKEEHTQLVKRIYKLCEIMEEQGKTIIKQNTVIIKQNWAMIYGFILGIVVGALFIFVLFIILYAKGTIQSWLF